jgi:hypothetical protein
VSDYGLNDWAIEVRSPAEAKDFSFNLCVQTGSGTRPASFTMCTVGTFPGGKARLGRDAYHSPPSSAEVKNEQELFSSPPKCLRGVWWDSFTLICLRFKQLRSFVFTLYILRINFFRVRLGTVLTRWRCSSLFA